MDDQGAASAAVAVTGTVVAVLATLAVPHLLSVRGPGGPSAPDPSSRVAPASVETRGWREAPASIDHAGGVLENVGGRRLLWRETVGVAPALSWDVPASGAQRWVLAGSSSAGGSSRVAVVIGHSSPVVVPSDQLSLFAVAGHERTRVTVTDLGNPLREEVLRIEEYAER